MNQELLQKTPLSQCMVSYVRHLGVCTAFAGVYMYNICSEFVLCLVCAVVPSILTPPVNFIYVVNETDPVIFMCSATGIPPPEITWMRNGVLLDENVDSRISLSHSYDPEAFPITGGNIYSVSHNLTISNTRDNDSDTYTCVASNGNARTPNMTRDFELVVQGRPPFVLA